MKKRKQIVVYNYPELIVNHLPCYFCKRKPVFSGFVFFIFGSLPEVSCEDCLKFIEKERRKPGSVKVRYYREMIKKGGVKWRKRNAIKF